MTTSVTLRFSTDDLASIRAWFDEHGTACDARLPARTLLERYITFQIFGNADWDRQEIRVWPVNV
jgi:hypothetical protein